MASTAATFIPNHFRDAFSTNWDMAAQQVGKRLEQYCTVENFVGERKRFNRFSKRANLTVKEGRATPTKVRDQESDLRWLDTELFDDAVHIDEYDDEFLADITSPKSGVIASMKAACDRTADKKILDSIFAGVYVGKLGTGSPVTFSASKEIAATFFYGTDGYTPGTPGSPATNLALTMDKIREGKTLLGSAEALGNDRPVLACRYKDMNALWGQLSRTNLDYSLPDVFSVDLLEKIIGVKFLQTEQINITSGVADLPMWIPSGVKVHAGQWNSYMDILPERSHALQLRMTGRIGALRFDDDRVIKIKVAV